MTHHKNDEHKGGTTTMVSDNGKELLQKYVGDMAALESHIEEAIDRQLDMTKDDAKAGPLIREFHDMVKMQRDKITALRDDLGSNAANPVKEIGSEILGKAAGLIDKVRADSISKSLRDDYTAFNLAAISYSMLYTTAKGVGSDEVANVAQNHLRGYARAVQKINHVIPDIVVAELSNEDGFSGSGVAGATREMVDQAWKSTDQSGMKLS
jgi:ferritin-like metal-binding protein YciE